MREAPRQPVKAEPHVVGGAAAFVPASPQSPARCGLQRGLSGSPWLPFRFRMNPASEFLSRHGVVADGSRTCTRELQSAIDAAAREGGHLVFPPGVYRSGTLELRSRMLLELLPGAVLQASSDLADYPAIAPGTEHKDRQPYQFLRCVGAASVAIRGGGRIDGAGPSFWHPEPGPWGWYRELAARPCPMVLFEDCEDLSLDGVEIANSPGWTLHLLRCRRVAIRGVTIRNNLFGPNTDGIDIDGCSDVRVSDCRIEAGDDAVVVKSSADAGPSERILVTNCSIATNCRALKLGAFESFHPMRQVVFSNCVVEQSVAVFGLYSRNGAVLEDIAVSNIVGNAFSNRDYNQPIHIDLARHSDDRPRGAIRNVTVDNMVCRTNGRVLLTAEPGSVVERVRLRGITLVLEDRFDPYPGGLTARGNQFSPRSAEARAARAAIVADSLRDLTVSDCAIDWQGAGDPPFHAFWGRALCGGGIDADGLRGSAPGLPTVALTDCDGFGVRNAG